MKYCTRYFYLFFVLTDNIFIKLYIKDSIYYAFLYFLIFMHKITIKRLKFMMEQIIFFQCATFLLSVIL